MKPPSGGGARLAGGACRRLPHGTPSQGALAACCLAGARDPGPGCLGARSPSPAAAAGSPPRPSACLYCSALLGSPLYFSSSLPPSVSLPPPSLARSPACSLPPSLALWLPLWLQRPPPPQLLPPAPAPRSTPTMTPAAPISAEVLAGARDSRRTPGGADAPLPRGPAPASPGVGSREPARAIVRGDARPAS